MERDPGATMTAPMRRSAALAIDLLAPASPAALASALLWLWWRPDRAQDWDAFGIALAITAIGLAIWMVGFVTNELFLASHRRQTLGERAVGLHLVLPDDPASRRLRVLGRATLRFGVALLVLSAAGLATEHVGEDVLGVGVAVLAGAAVVVAASAAGARGPVTVIERLCGIGVVLGAEHDGARPSRGSSDAERR